MVKKTKREHLSPVCTLSYPLAKQKLEDRLSAAARDKLAQASKESKEKQLQAERKRKAALFLQTLRGPVAGEPEAKRAGLDSGAQLEVGERSIDPDTQFPRCMSRLCLFYLQCRKLSPSSTNRLGLCDVTNCSMQRFRVGRQRAPEAIKVALK